MRYNYIEVFIDEDPSARYVDDEMNHNTPNLQKADDGILFVIGDFDPGASIVNCYIGIPETHPLFNWSTLDKTQWIYTGPPYYNKPPFSVECYKKINTYIIKQLEKAGVPTTREKVISASNA